MVLEDRKANVSLHLLTVYKNTSDIDLTSLDQFDKAECMSALGGSV